MKRTTLTLFNLFLIFSSICVANVPAAEEPGTITVPLGGNGWLSKNATARINNSGLTNWSAPSDIITVYFRTETAGDAQLSLKLSVPEGNAKISLTAEGKTFTKELNNRNSEIISIGSIHVKKPGYVKIDLKGLAKTGPVFANISDLIVSGPALEKGAAYVKNNEGNYFYWGHRGPSVHLKYEIPAKDIEWFYNEITVPVGQDKLGTYYMANGFSGGYFGMQVNSATERRVLFSIWSPFSTDDPKLIPDSMKVVLLKKGPITKTGEFGNEGSGGQSYMQYPWVAGKAYAFLVRAQPNTTKKTTTYTAYFKDVAKGDWQLVASFERPQSAVYLKGLHSFLENFSPTMGDQERSGHYQNQWAIDSKGSWYEITGATFTVDATASINYRKDYAGGTKGKAFYLRNCGFFNDFTPKNTELKKDKSGKPHPVIDFSKLP
ncbi:DUF3472 domain-containing protein [Pedobacter nyackensis]|uniref:DUF3472 domain-containing protein n=1 Tax=Pedobacter nyackensis TaxID=475255 RepID=UPI00292E0ACA|nr:DUF3472 domain-containing protein [Pedobacter nyackensis]